MYECVSANKLIADPCGPPDRNGFEVDGNEVPTDWVKKNTREEYHLLKADQPRFEFLTRMFLEYDWDHGTFDDCFLTFGKTFGVDKVSKILSLTLSYNAQSTLSIFWR